ncbi:hypothetical protein DQ353_12540 [Arthrobacter sp. AQ5-05]|uniref:hypothetical protein n=1 Tax=Arthrobacter sp. AQ5-05 TaxID=2184581 RepID=UPI000DCDA197|nr:hypothetical protein [Arthrobacter sp. AQ5-05]RAX48941.1 hypothetical protein DQ353_12540 [Arthrobacter sp. AQ5-05]
MLLDAPGASRTPPIFRLRASVTTDYYGDTVEDWENPVKAPLKRAQVQDVETIADDGFTRRVIKGQRLLIVPGAVDLAATDRVEIQGQVWRIEGLPVTRRGLASRVYTRATLTRSEA